MNWARLAAEAAERAGSHQARAMADRVLSIAGVLDGQWDAAIAHAEKAIEIWRTGFCGDFAGADLAAHARALFGAGAVQRAARGVGGGHRGRQATGPAHAPMRGHDRARSLPACARGRRARVKPIETLLEEVSQLIDRPAPSAGARTSTSNAPSCTA